MEFLRFTLDLSEVAKFGPKKAQIKAKAKKPLQAFKAEIGPIF